MEDNNKNCNLNKSGVGAATGTIIGFFGSLLLNSIILIPICIAIGIVYDKNKNKCKK